MRKYRVYGVHRHTGESVIETVDADDSEAAIDAIQSQLPDLLVERVELTVAARRKPSKPARRPKPTPDPDLVRERAARHRREPTMNWLLTISLGSFIGTSFGIVGGVFLLLMIGLSALSPERGGSGQTPASATAPTRVVWRHLSPGDSVSGAEFLGASVEVEEHFSGAGASVRWSASFAGVGGPVRGINVRARLTDEFGQLIALSEPSRGKVGGDGDDVYGWVRMSDDAAAAVRRVVIEAELSKRP